MIFDSKKIPVVLHNKEFRHFLGGRFCLMTGFRMLSSLLGWWVFSLTKDPLAIGFIGLAEVIPAVSTSIFSGYLIDINEKKKMLLQITIAYFILIAALLVPTFTAENSSQKSISLLMIYGIIFLTGICRAFIGPVLPTMIPKIVSKENLPRAVTFNQATFLIASVMGHAVGGLLIGEIGIRGTLYCVLILISLGFINFLFLKPQPPFQQNLDQKPIAAIREGFEFIFKTKAISGALMLDMFAVFFGGAVAMVPVFATDILLIGPRGFGLLNAASDIGAMAAIGLLAWQPIKQHQGKILLLAVEGFGLCIIAFGISNIFLFSFLLLLMSGILDGISVVVRGTIVQLKTPDEIRGRVMSANSVFIMSSNEMGQFESGIAAKLLGVVPSVVFGGVMTVLITKYLHTKNPELRKMNY